MMVIVIVIAKVALVVPSTKYYLVVPSTGAVNEGGMADCKSLIHLSKINGSDTGVIAHFMMRGRVYLEM